MFRVAAPATPTKEVGLMMNRPALLGLLAVLLTVPALGAEEPPKPPWSGSLGLSFLSTTGNSQTQFLGLDLGVKRIPDPWGLEIVGKYLRSSKGGATDAERSFVGVRGTRSLSERWSLFAGISGERDTFAGFDLRAVLEGGATYKFLTGPVHELAFDGGLTWTRENRVAGEDRNFLGGLLGLAYQWKLSETAAFTEKFRFYPDFDRTSNWRMLSETALKASLTGLLALKVGYEVRYSNTPVPGFHKTDTATTVSLVASL
jgi:putative salt-induced outer membrane protein